MGQVFISSSMLQLNYFKGLFLIFIKVFFHLLRVLSTLIDGEAAKSNIALCSSCRRHLKGKRTINKQSNLKWLT